MDRFDRAAVLTELADRLRANGSWTGETHLQKATYVLQELLMVPLNFEFVFYKHGPFSFDLREELTSMRADGFLVQVPQDPYGPILETTESSVRMRNEYALLIEANRPKIEFVANRLGDKGIMALEQLSTALYVRQTTTDLSVDEVANLVNELKPHVTVEAARLAASELDELASAARAVSVTG